MDKLRPAKAEKELTSTTVTTTTTVYPFSSRQQTSIFNYRNNVFSREFYRIFLIFKADVNVDDLLWSEMTAGPPIKKTKNFLVVRHDDEQVQDQNLSLLTPKLDKIPVP